MIDHISIAVRDIKAGEAFYTALLATIGFAKMREWPGAAVGSRPGVDIVRYTVRQRSIRSEAVAVECARALSFAVRRGFVRPTLHAVTRGSHI